MMFRFATLCALVCLLGCASPQQGTSGTARAFQFQEDTFSYPNELVWEYHFDPATGTVHTRRREPTPSYSHHCFVVARSARQFFQHARFDPALPREHPDFYREVIRSVVRRSPRVETAEPDRIVIPGYKHLREFSEDHEALLKGETGGAWQSYFQRGHWRMILPFARGQQARVRDQLVRSLDRNRPPVIHLVRFPRLTINHAMIVFEYARRPGGWEFLAYDPNNPDVPARLFFDEATRSFVLPRNDYFSGGRVDVYEIYHALLY
jgi:hypothetical protein